MKKILLSTVSVLMLGSVSVTADQFDDILQSKSSKQSTDKSKASTRGSKKGSASAEQIRTQEFVAVNSNQLAKEIAAGHGEIVDTLATLLKVEDKHTFIAKLQTNYSKIYTSKDMGTQEILNNISKI